MTLYLKCKNNSHDNILLKDNTSLYVGRSPKTGIQDKRCSRNQVEITANYLKRNVVVKQIGSNSSFIEEKEIKKGETAILHEGQTLYLVLQDHPHYLEFKSDDDDAPSTSLPKKRTLVDYFGQDGDNVKKQKMDCIDEDGEKESKGEVSVKDKLSLLQQSKTSFTTSALSQKAGEFEKNDIQTAASKRNPGWYNVEDSLLIFEAANLSHSSKILAFDMDGTLITTKSGKTFATDSNDWKILFPEIPKKLKQMHKEGYKLVIITNQLGIGKGKVKESDFKSKVEDIIKKLDVPFQVLAITKRGKYRKPNIGSWSWLKDHGNDDIVITSFTYVGDAAGRPKNWSPGKKKDFSASDRLFAINLEVPFHTPEEYFLSQKPAKFELPEFDPKSLKDLPMTSDGAEVVVDEQEVIVLVGYPASGKSTFAKKHLASKGYVVVNRDTLKTWQKCVAACEHALASGKSVVVDNTNPDKESRQRYINCAKKFKCKCRCFVMDITIEHAMHNNRFRELSGSEHDVVPRMILYSYRKKYEEPLVTEGFSQVLKINFTLDLEDEQLKKMYLMYTD